MRLSRIQSIVCLSFLAACAAPSKAPEQPVSSAPAPDAAPSVAALGGHEYGDGERELIAQLPSSKVSLLQGVALGERRGGVAISAKFELEHGKLSLSVYTAKAGVEADAEHNVLAELSGDPTEPEWTPKEEIFGDAAHITRAASHLTLLQRSKTTLGAVISKALAHKPGVAYSVTPAIRERAPIFRVGVATPGGGHVTVDVDGS
jgi:hypothetical protein